MRKKFYAVSYDIEENKIRTRISKLLKGYGERVQKSVFEIELNEKQLTHLQGEMKGMIGELDSIRWYNLCENCQKALQITGVGCLTKTPDVWIV